VPLLDEAVLIECRGTRDDVVHVRRRIGGTTELRWRRRRTARTAGATWPAGAGTSGLAAGHTVMRILGRGRLAPRIERRRDLLRLRLGERETRRHLRERGRREAQ